MANNNPALEGVYKFTRPGVDVFDLFKIKFADYDTGVIDAEIRNVGSLVSVSSASYHRQDAGNRTDLKFTWGSDKYHLWALDYTYKTFAAVIEDSAGNWSEEFTFTKM